MVAVQDRISQDKKKNKENELWSADNSRLGTIERGA